MLTWGCSAFGLAHMGYLLYYALHNFVGSLSQTRSSSGIWGEMLLTYDSAPRHQRRVIEAAFSLNVCYALGATLMRLLVVGTSALVAKFVFASDIVRARTLMGDVVSRLLSFARGGGDVSFENSLSTLLQVSHDVLLPMEYASLPRTERVPLQRVANGEVLLLRRVTRTPRPPSELHVRHPSLDGHALATSSPATQLARAVPEGRHARIPPLSDPVLFALRSCALC